MTPVRGEGLDPAARVEVVNARLETLPAGASWALRGTTRNLRYTTRDEKERLSAIQPALGRSGASRAALIPIKRARCGGTWRRTSAAGSSRTSRATRLSVSVISHGSRAVCSFPRSRGTLRFHHLVRLRAGARARLRRTARRAAHKRGMDLCGAGDRYPPRPGNIQLQCNSFLDIYAARSQNRMSPARSRHVIEEKGGAKVPHQVSPLAWRSLMRGRRQSINWPDARLVAQPRREKEGFSLGFGETLHPSPPARVGGPQRRPPWPLTDPRYAGCRHRARPFPPTRNAGIPPSGKLIGRDFRTLGPRSAEKPRVGKPGYIVSEGSWHFSSV
jgi:hypothetical protein